MSRYLAEHHEFVGNPLTGESHRTVIGNCIVNFWSLAISVGDADGREEAGSGII